MDMRLEYSQSATRLPTAGKVQRHAVLLNSFPRFGKRYTYQKRCASPKYRFRQTWMGTSVNTS